MPNIYLPYSAVIEQVKQETPDIKTFELRPEKEGSAGLLDFIPGQFFQVSLFGWGEAPISICSVSGKESLELSIKSMGKLTSKMHSLNVGEKLWLRGPFGNGFDVEALKGKDLLFVLGGIGLAPLRGLIELVISKRKDYKKVTILYGARTPDDLVFKEDLKRWGDRDDIEVGITVDKARDSWKGHVGVVTTLLPKFQINPADSVALVCGPPIMIKFVIMDLLKMGFEDERIVTTLERYMKCGVGKCGHCNIGHRYVCTDGPVFTHKQLKESAESFA